MNEMQSCKHYMTQGTVIWGVIACGVVQPTFGRTLLFKDSQLIAAGHSSPPAKFGYPLFSKNVT
jgi:hypothetical protein